MNKSISIIPHFKFGFSISHRIDLNCASYFYDNMYQEWNRIIGFSIDKALYYELLHQYSTGN